MTVKCEETRSLNPTPADNLGKLILCCGALPHALGMFNSIPGLSTLDARKIPCPAHENKNVSERCPVSPREADVCWQNSLPFHNHHAKKNLVVRLRSKTSFVAYPSVSNNMSSD